MSMYKMFQTDEGLERDGIIIDYGDFRVTLARAGGANKSFARVLDAKVKPYRRAIQTESMDPEVAKRLMLETYAETVIRKWEVKRNDGWQVGIDAEDGGVLPFDKKTIVEVLSRVDMQDLWLDLQEQAGKATLFRQSVREVSAGN